MVEEDSADAVREEVAVDTEEVAVEDMEVAVRVVAADTEVVTEDTVVTLMDSGGVRSIISLKLKVLNYRGLVATTVVFAGVRSVGYRCISCNEIHNRMPIYPLPAFLVSIGFYILIQKWPACLYKIWNIES